MARFLPYSKRDQITNSFLYMERNGEPMDALLARFENIHSQMEPTPDLGLSLSVLKRVINDPEANLRLLELERRGGVQRISDAVAVLLDFHKAKSASRGVLVNPHPQSYYPNPGAGINAMRNTSRSPPRRERERGRSPTIRDRTPNSRERIPMGEAKCYACGKVGHYARECRSRSRSREDDRNQEGGRNSRRDSSRDSRDRSRSLDRTSRWGKPRPPSVPRASVNSQLA